MKVNVKNYGSDLPAPMRYEDIDGDFVILTCSGVRDGEAEVEGGRKKRNVLVLLFKEAGDERGLYLNVTQIKTLVERYGDESESWVGKPIPVERTVSEFDNKPFKKLAVAAASDWDGLFKQAGVTVPKAGSGAGSVTGGIRGMTKGETASGGKASGKR